MLVFLRRYRFVGALAVLSLVSSPLVACAAEAMSSDMPMACCQEGKHDCGPAMKPSDCCAHSSQQSTQKTTIKSEPRANVTPTFVPLTHPAAPCVPIREATTVAVEHPAVIDTGPPDCLAFSVLLI